MKWQRVTLGQVVNFYNGKAIKPGIKGRYPAYGSNGLIGYAEKFMYEKGIILGRVGANCGSVGLSLTSFWPSDNTIVVVNKPGYDMKFLYYRLKNASLNSYAGGAAQPLITQTVLRPIELLIPRLEAQIKIADILSAYDDLIENNLRRIQLLEEAARCRYKLMMEDAGKWEKVNLYDLAEIQMGFAFNAKDFNEEGRGTPIIRIRDIPNQWTRSYTSQKANPLFIVKQGDLLIGMDGDFHMNEWAGQEGYLVQRVCRLRTLNPRYQSFLRQALTEPINFYQNTISGATVAHLGAKHLKEIHIQVPPDREYELLLEGFNKLRELRINLYNQNVRLRQARDILLPRLMSGEIDVSSVAEPEAVIADALVAI